MYISRLNRSNCTQCYSISRETVYVLVHVKQTPTTTTATRYCHNNNATAFRDPAIKQQTEKFTFLLAWHTDKDTCGKSFSSVHYMFLPPCS